MSNPDLSAFAKYIPGFEFLQNLTQQAASGAVPGAQSGVPGMPPLSHWVAPTFDVEELDKRIQDLKAVHFWLDQNTKALSATIQALEVQKMTLATLKSMNVSFGEVAEAFKIKPEQFMASPAPEPAAAEEAAPEAPEAADETAASAPAVDPMQWWGALTQQFQVIAGDVMRDMADQASRAAEQVAQTVQAGAEAASQMAATDADAAAPGAAKPARAAKPAAKSKTASAKAAPARKSAVKTAPARRSPPASKRSA